MELVPVEKSGDYIEVHPSCLAAHKALGWKECDKQEPVSDDSTAVAHKKRGQPAKG